MARPHAATPADLSPDRLLAEATRLAGHDDWGDTGFVEPLGLLIDSCRATGDLTADGWRVLKSVLLRHLRNRLYLNAYLDRHAEGRRTGLGSPLVITGLPRTGTSLLHNLLAQDPRHRYLRLWEALHPVPPDDDGGGDEERLVGQAERWLDRFYARVPEFRTIRPLTPRGPEECDRLLQNAFASLHFQDMFDARAYADWFTHGDLTGAYEYYALQLRVLGGDRGDRRWVLKSPGHLGHLDELLRVLPDARVLHCHRHPSEAVPSYASLVRAIRRPNTQVVSPTVVGDQALDRCATAVGRALEVRAAADTGRFFDVSFRELTADPLGVVARIYDWLDTSLDDPTIRAMRRWLADHPSGRRGVHRYDPSRFGLRADRVRPAFTTYLRRFAAMFES